MNVLTKPQPRMSNTQLTTFIPGVSALRAGDPPWDEMSLDEIETCLIWQYFRLESIFPGTNVQTRQAPSPKSSV